MDAAGRRLAKAGLPEGAVFRDLLVEHEVVNLDSAQFIDGVCDAPQQGGHVSLSRPRRFDWEKWRTVQELVI